MSLVVEPEVLDGIKLTRTTRGYTWEIRRYYKFGNGSWKDVVESITRIDAEMRERFNFKHDNTKAPAGNVEAKKTNKGP